jgi:hypothetical protein
VGVGMFLFRSELNMIINLIFLTYLCVSNKPKEYHFALLRFIPQFFPQLKQF